MKPLMIAIACAGIIASAGSASANYRLGPNPSVQERESYELQHTAMNKFHPTEARAESTERRPVISYAMPSDAERRWFKQADGPLW